MKPRAVTAASRRARSARFGASAVSRDGVRVSSTHDISQSASAAELPKFKTGSASVPCDTTTKGARKIFYASSAGGKTPGSKSRPVQFFRLRARVCECAMTGTVCQMEPMLRTDY